ncbi:hypothetical protein A2U01_0060590, partial [Trifolium medium]|nr:hypothetical protein [Trifolium medium]
MRTCMGAFASQLVNNSGTEIYCKEDRHEVDIKLVKQPKVEEQRNVDAKPADELPKVVAPK